jgi:hypothetical protein
MAIFCKFHKIGILQGSATRFRQLVAKQEVRVLHQDEITPFRIVSEMLEIRLPAAELSGEITTRDVGGCAGGCVGG